MGFWAGVLDQCLGKQVIVTKYLEQFATFHTDEGVWMFQKVQYLEKRPGIRLGAMEFSPERVVGYGYRVTGSPRPVHPDHLHYHGADLHRAIVHAEQGMHIADRERLETCGLFK